MADVRSLLRQQRAARQPAKPAPKQSAPTSKKRKAADSAVEERKRTRTEERAGVPADFFDHGVAHEAEPPPSEAVATSPAAQTEDATQLPHAPALSPPPPPTVDAELDAFMAEMDQAAAEAKRNPAAYAGAVIEAAPMTAAELAAQAREEQIARRAQREEEMEEEKDEAARALQDEFDEMDGLEERVKKLREQREALRAKHMDTEPRQEDVALPTPQVDAEDSESEDEDWDDWRFRSA